MKNEKPSGIIFFGRTEIIISGVTLLSLAFTELFRISSKPYNVLWFVTFAALISLTLGIGILQLNSWARKALVFFSEVIILIKILIFFGIITLHGALLETVISSKIKDMFSLLYHVSIIIYFCRPSIKNLYK